MNPDLLQKLHLILLSSAAGAVTLYTVVEGDAIGLPSAGDAAARSAEVAEATPPPAPVAQAGAPGAPDSPDGPAEFAAVPSESIVAGAGSGEGSGDPWRPRSAAATGATCAFEVNRATMASRMHRREPEGTEGPFLADGNPVIAFFETSNPGPEVEVIVRWSHTRTGESFITNATAGTSERWRTWVDHAFPLDKVGTWRVEIMDSSRCVASALQFELTAPGW